MVIKPIECGIDVASATRADDVRDRMTALKAEPDTSPPAIPAAPNSLEELKAALDAVRELLALAPQRPAAYLDLHVFCTDLLRVVDARIREVDPGAEITAEQLESVCILLGPY